MATTAAPYGLRPINHVGGLPYAGATNLINIASGYAVNIFYGDIVAINAATGTIVKVTATGADGTTNAFPAGVIGVFLGCTYTDPDLGYKLFRQSWPTGTVASDAQAYVVDDPSVLFKVQANGALAQTTLGGNVSVVQNAGVAISGNSRVAVNAASVAASTFLPFRIVEFVNDSDSRVGDAFTDVIVRFNFGIHSYESATGLA
jgi:hypothetical protein